MNYMKKLFKALINKKMKTIHTYKFITIIKSEFDQLMPKLKEKLFKLPLFNGRNTRYSKQYEWNITDKEFEQFIIDC